MQVPGSSWVSDLSAPTEYFYEQLKNDPRYAVPQTFPRYSTKKVLTTSFMHGEPIDSDKVQALSQKRRNDVGKNFLELYLRELTEFQKVQTDPHFGNYKIKTGPPEQLVLMDFGAVRELDDHFVRAYRQLIEGALNQDASLIQHAGEQMGFLKANDPQQLIDQFTELCFRIVEPFTPPEWDYAPDGLMDAEGHYDWASSDLPQRVLRIGANMVVSFKFRKPPDEVIFLDRKLGGTFTFLSVLGCHMESRRLLQSYACQQPV